MYLILAVVYCAIVFRFPTVCGDAGPGFGFAYLTRIVLSAFSAAIIEPVLILGAISLRKRIGRALAATTYCWTCFVAFACIVAPFSTVFSGSCPPVRQAQLAPYWPWVYLSTAVVSVVLAVIVGVRIRSGGRAAPGK